MPEPNPPTRAELLALVGHRCRPSPRRSQTSSSCAPAGRGYEGSASVHVSGLEGTEDWSGPTLELALRAAVASLGLPA